MTDIQFGLMLRAQFPADDDMQQRFEELVEQARLADRLGFASITKGMHYSTAPWRDLQQFPFLSHDEALAADVARPLS
jgi:alkanesulfonate monooxygenase SsuD/methylene tetrahydromethanopterin reductase-like flavin-dependent oxidoreductase (luciferase family)